MFTNILLGNKLVGKILKCVVNCASKIQEFAVIKTQLPQKSKHDLNHS